MERRKFLVGMGSLAAGSAAALGTGAFSTASANRTATVAIAGDGQGAYLGLEDTSPYAKQIGSGDREGELAFDFTGQYGAQNGSGINTRAETCFNNVFKVVNNGTKNVNVWIARKDPNSGGAESVQFGAGDEGNIATNLSDNGEVNIGQPPAKTSSDLSDIEVSENGCTILDGGYVRLQPGEEVGVDISFFVASADPQEFPEKDWQINGSVDVPTQPDYSDSSLRGHPFP